MEILEKLKSMVINPEWHMKLTAGLAVSLFITIVGGTWAAGRYISAIENRITSNKQTIVVIYEDVKDNTKDIKDTNKELNLVKIDQAKIFTELSSIKTMQIRMLDILEKRD